MADEWLAQVCGLKPPPEPDLAPLTSLLTHVEACEALPDISPTAEEVAGVGAGRIDSGLSGWLARWSRSQTPRLQQRAAQVEDLALVGAVRFRECGQ